MNQQVGTEPTQQFVRETKENLLRKYFARNIERTLKFRLFVLCTALAVYVSNEVKRVKVASNNDSYPKYYINCLVIAGTQ